MSVTLVASEVKVEFGGGGGGCGGNGNGGSGMGGVVENIRKNRAASLLMGEATKTKTTTTM